LKTIITPGIDKPLLSVRLKHCANQTKTRRRHFENDVFLRMISSMIIMHLSDSHFKVWLSW